MTGRTVTVRPIGRHTVELEGPGVFDVCADLGVPKMRPVGGGKVWWIPQARADDTMAALEHRGFNVVLVVA